MAYIRGEAREQTTMFPVTLDELIPVDHVCRVIEAFVGRLNMAKLGFVRAEPAETGRPGYDPRDLLKLYLYGYLQQVRSSRRLEAECQRNVEVMWLLGRLQPDYKSIAEFRRIHSQAVSAAGTELVRFARSVGLVKGETVAVDGSKFRAVSSEPRVRAREAIKRYLEQLDRADEQEEVVIDPSVVQAALEKLQNDPEPEVRRMPIAKGFAPAYNVQLAVDAEYALIVAQQVTKETGDNTHLQPMAEAAKLALGYPESLQVVADAGYANGEQAQACEAQGITPAVPVIRAVNNRGDGSFFDRSAFHYDEPSDTFCCPAKQTLRRKQVGRKDCAVVYAASPQVCGACALKHRCTGSSRRLVQRHLYEGALRRMQQRATPEMMRLRRSTVEHPFASLKYRIFGHPRFLLRGRKGAQTEISLAAMVYNLKRMLHVLGGTRLRVALAF
ncbi:MAG TPA: IS1182 family transposase [Candidatus Bathyarchaeia archaeon]|nr:IS1182 family transposase [Candidatus Bathyarchaeia archaeon]